MYKIRTEILTIAALCCIFCRCATGMTYPAVKSEVACEEKGGYWYKGQCWKEFDDDGIAEKDIDAVVAEEMAAINNSQIRMDGKTYPLIGFFPEKEGKEMMLIAVYGNAPGNYSTLIFPQVTEKKISKEDEVQVLRFAGDVLGGTMDSVPNMKGTAKIHAENLDELALVIQGTLSQPGDPGSSFSFSTNEALIGAGSSSLEIVGDSAFLSGTLGTRTYAQIKDMIVRHPKVKTLVLQRINGSLNDAVNMHTGRLVHENGLKTVVLSNSDIASGGVDLFCAGVERVVEKGAKIGVHSWCCVNDRTAIEIPKEHPAHQYQIQYFSRAMGSKKGPAFYFYTLSAAPFDGIHYMSEEEIKSWEVATQFLQHPD